MSHGMISRLVLFNQQLSFKLFRSFVPNFPIVKNSVTILGCFEIVEDPNFRLTELASSLDVKYHGKIKDIIEKSPFRGKSKTYLPIYGFDDEKSIIVTGLGKISQNVVCHRELININKENIRTAMGIAARECEKMKINSPILADDCGDASASAEGIFLCSHECSEWKSKKPGKLTFNCLSDDSKTLESFKNGTILANAQNYARSLMEIPGNLKYPEALAKKIFNDFASCVNVSTVIRDKKWIESQGMNLFLSVANGSDKDPVFLEMKYFGCDDAKSIILIGKGVTFDSGGISIKPAKNMKDMKGDMGGAACVLGALKAASELKLPINITVLIPFTENLINGQATKPGDVFISRSGVSVEVDNTDAEGRLILADALTYAATFHSDEIIDIATLTGSMRSALGDCAAGFFTHNSKMKSKLLTAAEASGDRVWHMPLFDSHHQDIKSSIADISNIGKSGFAGASTAAAFLKEFVKTENWMHIDIAGVMSTIMDSSYIPKGMTGRPTRTIIEYLKISCDDSSQGSN